MEYRVGSREENAYLEKLIKDKLQEHLLEFSYYSFDYLMTRKVHMYHPSRAALVPQ